MIDSMLPGDPLAGLTMAGIAAAFRAGELTAERVTAAYLARIASLDPALGAFEEVCTETALQEAADLDRRRRAGEDLGALMGLPVAIKDIFAVDGTEVHAGSNMPVSDLVGPQGPFVQRLRALGCVVLGKTRTTEFAFVPSGINAVRGTPRNPHDDAVFRIPGGSSSGSAVALAAGLCALSIGSDTGGSVRVPAALNGLVGLKTSVGLWPTDGVFSLSTTFDSIGLFAHTVGDMALAFATIEGRETRTLARTPAGLRLGVPSQYFLDDLEAPVAEAFRAALTRLEAAGAILVPIELPEAAERFPLIGRVLGFELAESAGRARLAAALPQMDPLVGQRVEAGMAIPAADYAAMRERHRAIESAVTARLAGLDGWLSPTVPCVAPPLAACREAGEQGRLNLRLTQNTQPGNLFGQCGLSLPLPTSGLPIGLQVLANKGQDEAIIAVALAMESTVCRM
jgi:aspartyl-tRNA(Asn)/glutamyl-tRNA(Gln) amidotransferase subunit A